MADLLRVTVKTSDAASANLLARMCLAEQLAGHAHVVEPGETAVIHLGEVEACDEYRVVLCTTSAAYPTLGAFLSGRHPVVSATAYVPTPEAYARWLTEVTARSRNSRTAAPGAGAHKRSPSAVDAPRLPA